MARFGQLRVLLALVVAMISFGLSGILSPGTAQTPPPGLGGSTFTAAVPGASCTGSTISFSTSGTVAGGYTGTFQESGTVTFDAAGNMLTFNAQFSIQADSGHVVTGSKDLTGNASQNQDSANCLFGSGWQGRDAISATAWDLRFVAQITTPDGQTCDAVGSSIFQLIQDSRALNDQFSETFYNDVSSPTPTCTGGGGEEPPAEPATKDDCKDGGWEAFGFRNQGECIAFVNERDG